jgi:hypothetical protein
MKSAKRSVGIATMLVLLGATAAACMPLEPTRMALTITKPPPPPPPPPSTLPEPTE